MSAVDVVYYGTVECLRAGIFWPGAAEEPAGALHYIGRFRLGAYAEYGYHRCNRCGTDYVQIDGVVKCNGFIISKCPWCSDDPRSKRASLTLRREQ